MYPIDCSGYALKGVAVANLDNVNPEAIASGKELITSLISLEDNDAMKIFVLPHVTISAGMSLADFCKTELILFCLAISNADGVVSEEETLLLNTLFDLEGTPTAYQSMADTIPMDYLQLVPVWVQSLGYCPILSTDQACNLAEGTISQLGRIVSLVDGIETIEIMKTNEYAQLCRNYLLTH